jgi:hypothetical protein
MQDTIDIFKIPLLILLFNAMYSLLILLFIVSDMKVKAVTPVALADGQNNIAP